MFRSNILVILFLILATPLAYGVQVPREQIKNMSFNKLQKLRFAYIEFLMKVEQDDKRGLLPSPKKKTSYFQNFWKDLLIANAYAVAPDGSICFFGGWASRMSGGKCSTPWKNKSDENIKQLGAYDSNSACGSSTKFRCNPVLFGSPKNDGQGMCVDTDGTYNHLTEKCERASRAFIPQIIESYQMDPTAIDKLGGEIKNFCDAFDSYDSCDDLAKRIREITGQDLGKYPSGAETNPDSKGPVGNRTRNVEVKGENLRPGADYVEKSSTVGAQVLNRCQNFLKDKDDVKDRNILSYMQSEECSPEIGSTFSKLEDFEKLAKTLDTKKAVSSVNAKAFEQNILALLSNDIRFGNKNFDFSSKDGLFDSLVGDYPQFKKNEDFKKAFDRAYDNLDREVKAGRLYPFEPESTRAQFNNLSSMANEACSQIRDKYQQKFGDPGFLSRWASSDEHDAFFASEVKSLHQEMNVLLQESVIGHLMSTSHFKDNVFDPSEEAVIECARNPSFQLIKQPISMSAITEGHKEIEELLKDGLDKVHDNAKIIDGEDKDTVNEVLAEYLKTDPHIVNMTMDDLDANEQQRLGVLICTETNNVLSSDKTWRYVDVGLGSLGAVAGVVLLATGVGSPLGVALTAASIGMVGYTGTRAVNEYQNASERMKAADTALAQRRQRMEEYLKQAESVGKVKRDAIQQGGLAVVTGLMPVKALNLIKPIKMPKPKINIFRKKATVNPHDKVPILKFQRQNALPKKSKITFKKIAPYTLAAWAASIAFVQLTTEEQVKVADETSTVFTNNGLLQVPSAVLGSKDISKLNIEESFALLGKIIGPLTQENIDKLEALLQPEAYADQPQAVKDFMAREAIMVQALGNRIAILQGEEVVEEVDQSVKR